LGPSTTPHDFFGKESHLTVSRPAQRRDVLLRLSRVYTFGPTFRAENSNTSRHLAEFWMIEPEIAFATCSDASSPRSSSSTSSTLLLTERADDMKFFDERIEKGLLARLKHVLETPFRRLPYTEAIKILEKAIGGKKFEYPVKWGTDLQSEHERFLTEEHFKQPVILMNYPKQIKAFYMRLNDPGTDGAPGDTVAAMDVLVPGIGEIIGGSQREERLDKLDRRIAEMKPAGEGILVVPRPAPLRHRPARGLRPGLRAADDVRDGHAEHPRRDPVPACAQAGGVLLVRA
jgi:asparaginyl-tRNA synthetase